MESTRKFAAQFLQETVSKCLLCMNPACSSACKNGIDCGRIIRSLRFDNYAGAYQLAVSNKSCLECTSKECEKACLKGKITSPIPLQKVISNLLGMDEEEQKSKFISTRSADGIEDIDLSVDFMGCHFENPFCLSSSVVGSNYDMVAKAFDEGWAGVAFKTIGFFTPNEVSPRFTALRKEDNTFVGFKNLEQISDHTLEENLEFFQRLKKNYPSKIIIASIMGRNEEEWELLAKKCQEAGADILEANFSCPQMTEKGTGSDVGQDPELVAKYTAAIKRGSNLPLLAKMTPNLGNMEIPALAAVKAGADGIAAINTIKSLMNVNLTDFSSSPKVSGKSSVSGYSGKSVKPIALRFISDMKKCPDLKSVPISGMGGIETWQDVSEGMSIGCGTIQGITAIMQYGYRIISDMIDGMKAYLKSLNLKSVSQIIGKALPAIIPAEDLDRDTKQFPKFIREKCIGCGRCVISCYDGGHQALSLNQDGKPVMNKNCVGCHLCILVCPSGAIVPGTRIKK